MSIKGNRHQILGIVVTATIGMLTTSITVAIASDDPLCYMRSRDGRQVDLSKLCDRPTPNSTAPTTSTQPTANSSRSNSGNSPINSSIIQKIDPKTPIKNPRVVTDKPPDFWYEVPNLSHPPIKGPTSDSR